VDRESNQFSFPIKGGADVLIAAGRAIDDDGIALEDLGIRRPSLDEVFLSLTGHGAGAGSNAPGDTSGSGSTYD
jgi:ABC-2 type transport system ATP-binding protein